MILRSRIDLTSLRPRKRTSEVTLYEKSLMFSASWEVLGGRIRYGVLTPQRRSLQHAR